jgi:hypothetical protein
MQVERERGAIPEYSGVRVSNTWVIYLLVGNNPGKPGLIPHNLAIIKDGEERSNSPKEEPAAD